MTDAPFTEGQDRFLAIIADGGTWRHAQEKLKISSATIAGWLRENAEFQKQYARAYDVRADAIFEEMLKIADTPMEGEKVKIDKDGKEEITRGDMIEHRRLQVETRKWMLGKMKPKVYGDKIQTEVSGPDGGAVQVVTKIERVIVRPKADGSDA